MIAKAKKRERIISPQEGKQTAFLSTEADVAIYGGAAGGGKTYAVLLDPLRHIAVPKFNAVIFRRTNREIEDGGGLWETSFDLYPHAGGSPNISKLRWTFNRSSIEFHHLEHINLLSSMGGSQYAAIYFDELTTFEEQMFWFLFSRNRTACGIKAYIRATCNPEPDSWVAKLLEWWIDPDTGFPIEERSGVLRWGLRISEELFWYATFDECYAAHKEYVDDLCEKMSKKTRKVRPTDLIKSFTFIPSKVEDNEYIDPSYIGGLLMLPEVDRKRLLEGNWHRVSGGLIKEQSFSWYESRGDAYHLGGQDYAYAKCRRFATIDTAGGGKDKADQEKGKEASDTAVGIWDSVRVGNTSLLFLLHVMLTKKDYLQQKDEIIAVLAHHNCRVVDIEEATNGVALGAELRQLGIQVNMIPTKIAGQKEGNDQRGAKYERAVAAGLFTTIENGWLSLPKARPPWVRGYLTQLCSWKGRPKDRADQIDITSYAAYHCKNNVARWQSIGAVPIASTVGGLR